jgi:hypothetical protein
MLRSPRCERNSHNKLSLRPESKVFLSLPLHLCVLVILAVVVLAPMAIGFNISETEE